MKYFLFLCLFVGSICFAGSGYLVDDNGQVFLLDGTRVESIPKGFGKVESKKGNLSILKFERSVVSRNLSEASYYQAPNPTIERIKNMGFLDDMYKIKKQQEGYRDFLLELEKGL